MTKPIVFISYSHEDEKEKEQLLSHLKVLENAGLVELWLDDRIPAGADWEGEIKKAIAQASVAILLVTTNFLTSDFTLTKEIPEFLKRRQDEGLKVFPIIAKACYWEEIGWLAGMQVKPKNAVPVWSGNPDQIDQRLADITKEISSIVKKKAKPESSLTTKGQSPWLWIGVISVLLAVLAVIFTVFWSGSGDDTGAEATLAALAATATAQVEAGAEVNTSTKATMTALAAIITEQARNEDIPPTDTFTPPPTPTPTLTPTETIIPVTPTFTSSPTSLPTPTSTPAIIFQEDFSSSELNWWVGESSSEYADEASQIVDGSLHRSMSSKKPALGWSPVPGISAKNFMLKANVTLLETSGRAAFVIVFRRAGDDFYRVEFYNDGRYLVMLRYEGVSTPISDWHSSDAIKLDPYVTNSLGILVEDSNFTIYANDQQLMTIKDTTLSEAGEIGLGIYLPDAGQTVTFSIDDVAIAY